MKLLLDMSICEAVEAQEDLRQYLITVRKSQGFSGSELVLNKQLHVSVYERSGNCTVKLLFAMLKVYGLGFTIKTKDGLWPRRIPLQGGDVLGGLVKSCRENVSITALAKRVGLSRGTIEWIEAGKSSVRVINLFLIAKEFDWVLKFEPINSEQ